jgi:predicted ATPase
MRITRLRVKNWRNFKDAEVRFERRCFLVGANAAGKSNLLDAIKFLRDLVIDGGGLPYAVKERRGVSEIRSVFARNRPNVCLEIDLGDDDHLRRWTYELEFKADAKSKSPVIVREVVYVQMGDSINSERLVNRPDREDEQDPDRLKQTALEQVNANKSFREIADFFAGITYLHAVPQIIRDPRRAVGTNDPYGGDLIARIAKTPERTRKSRLRRMQEALAVAVPQLSDLELIKDEKGVPHLRANYRHWRPNGAWQTEESFSDGTLRLLGLIWALQEPGGPLLLEEPELSLNYGVIAELAPLMARATAKSKRQAVITTHSLDLLSNGVALDEVYVLSPTPDGTTILAAVDVPELQAMRDDGVPLGEAVLPYTKAEGVDTLATMDLAT